MKIKTIFTIAKKDLLEVKQNKTAWGPMLIVPLIFTLVIPLAFLLLPRLINIAPEELMPAYQLKGFLANLPESMTAILSGLTEVQSMQVLVLGYLFAPMFLIFPLMISTIIAAESFAGERERKTIEALLYTPATDAELFVGKSMAAFLPSLVVTWISFIIYSVVLNVAGFSIYNHLWFPVASWYPLMFWITPAVALLGIAFTVLISARTPTFMGAYQTSGSLVIIVLGLVAGQATGLLYLSVGISMLVGLFFWLVAGLLTWYAIRLFNRSKLLTAG
jgi:ABC-type transport system involved in multi-copper enzyme maturation permease subunit